MLVWYCYFSVEIFDQKISYLHSVRRSKYCISQTCTCTYFFHLIAELFALIKYYGCTPSWVPGHITYICQFTVFIGVSNWSLRTCMNVSKAYKYSRNKFHTRKTTDTNILLILVLFVWCIVADPICSFISEFIVSCFHFMYPAEVMQKCNPPETSQSNQIRKLH